jgi:hypothetical protein
MSYFIHKFQICKLSEQKELLYLRFKSPYLKIYTAAETAKTTNATFSSTGK